MEEIEFYTKHRSVSREERRTKDGGIMRNGGISVREYMATHILNGLLCSEEGPTLEDCVECAIRATDMLQQKLSDERLMDYREMRKRVPHNSNPTMQNPNATIKNDSK